jgi:FkbM family methyltransferase
MVRTPLLVALVVALAGALAFYMVRDLTRHEHHDASTPCAAGDTERKVVTTVEGKFCIENDTDDLIKTTLKGQRMWEPEIVDQFKKYVHAGDLVVDAGAYIGEHTMQLARLAGPTGTVIAFEPQLAIYEQLLVNLELNHMSNVRAEFAALGATNARVTMNAPNEANAGATKVGKGGNIVPLRTLDSYKLDKVAFMKIDVEGFEYDLLQGAKDTIARDHPILSIEIWGKNQPRVLPLLDSYGYRTVSIGPDDFIALPK